MGTEVHITAERMQQVAGMRHVATRMETEETTAQAWMDARIETLNDTCKAGKAVTLPGRGGVYLERRRDGCAFTFH